jgi:uncharacterized protein
MSQPHQMQQLLKQVLHFQLQQQLEWFLQLEFLLQKKMSLLQQKQAKDQAIELEKKAILQEKELKATIIQMITQHKIRDTDGDVAYQFIDDGKIKKQYINQQIYNALVAGSLVIARDHESYAFLPKALADRINAKLEGFIIVNTSEKNEAVTDEEDPYAAYVIPDDLMW